MINGKHSHKKQQAEASKNVLRQVRTRLLILILQALCMVIQANRDVLSGKSPLDVVPWMITQGVELILKAHRAEKNLKECDRKSRSNK
jgi:hypothetical protein